MEEKLYFKPASYGKGIKKKEKPAKGENPKNEKNHRVGKTIILLVFLTIIILIILWLLRGKTTNTSEQIPNVKNTAVTCTSDSLAYPFFVYDDAKARELNIKMIFSEEELKSISLDYSLLYDSVEAIKGSEAHNHAAMNISFGKAGLNPDAYSAKYTMLSDHLRMSLYSVTNKLNLAAKPYFLIESEGDFPTEKSALRKNYESQGFTCEDSESTTNN